MPLVALTAQDIDTAGIEINVDLPQNWLDHELGDARAKSLRPGNVRARLSRSGTSIVVRGEVKASVVVPCARCLEPANAELVGELSLLLKPAPVSHEPREKSAPDKKPARAAGDAPGDPAKWAEAAAKMMPGWAAATKKVRDDEKAAGKKARPALKTAHKARKEKEPDEYEFTADEADSDTYDGDTVVLDVFIREALLLELPNFPLCSDACPGIRPVRAVPETDVGVSEGALDPRLAPLKALSASLSKKMRSNGKHALPDAPSKASDQQAQTEEALPEVARNTAKKKR